MSIDGGSIGGSAGGAPVSMELLQLLAADPKEFKKRMELLDQSKKDFDEQMAKQHIVGDVLALRKEAADAIAGANKTLADAKADAAKLLSTAKDKAEKLVSSAEAKAADIVVKATDEAYALRADAASVLDQATRDAAGLKARESAAEAAVRAADAKYESVEPDRLEFQRQSAAAKKAIEDAAKERAALMQKRGALETAAQQIARALSGSV